MDPGYPASTKRFAVASSRSARPLAPSVHAVFSKLYARIMTKRPAGEGGLPPAKRSRSSTSQGKTSPAGPRRGRKSLPIGASLSSSKSSDSAAIRRRMNPESLAGRLGPELVKELEGLLKTGITEMPSFAVRQEIQQRYNIDRRHIYDWFHNKGLRVTTSERREERRALRARDSIHVPTTRTMVGYWPRQRVCLLTCCEPCSRRGNAPLQRPLPQLLRLPRLSPLAVNLLPPG